MTTGDRRPRFSRRALLIGAAGFACVWGCATMETPLPHFDEIPLPEPRLEGPLSLEETLDARRSVRDYAPEPLSLAEAGQLLWAAQGVTDPRGLRTSPSAGALYPLEIYLATGQVEDLDVGVFRYQPANHSLVQVAYDDRRERLARAALGQAFVRRAPAVLAITAVPERTTRRYGYRGHRYVYMEAGHASENIYLQCVSLGLGTVAVGAFDDDDVAAILALPKGEVALYLMPLGRLIESHEDRA